MWFLYVAAITINALTGESIFIGKNVTRRVDSQCIHHDLCIKTDHGAWCSEGLPCGPDDLHRYAATLAAGATR